MFIFRILSMKISEILFTEYKEISGFYGKQ